MKTQVAIDQSIDGIRLVKDHYEEMSETFWGRYRKRLGGIHSLHMRGQAMLSAIECQGTILDAGCGPGFYAHEILKNGRCRVLEIDISRNMLRLAKRSLEKARLSNNADFVVADIGALPLRGGCVDTLVCIGVLQHLPHRERALRQFRRVAKRGAKIFIQTANSLSPLYAGLKCYTKFLKKVKGEFLHTSTTPIDQGFRFAKEELAGMGFLNVKKYEMLFTCADIPNLLIGFFIYLEELLEKIPLLKRLGAVLVLTAENSHRSKNHVSAKYRLTETEQVVPEYIRFESLEL